MQILNSRPHSSVIRPFACTICTLNLKIAKVAKQRRKIGNVNCDHFSIFSNLFVGTNRSCFWTGADRDDVE